MTVRGRVVGGAALAVVFAVAFAAWVAVVLVGSHPGRRSGPKSPPAGPVTTLPPALTAHTPATVAPSGTPGQESVDQQFAATIADTPGIRTGAAAAVRVPAPSRPLPAANDPIVWARQFVPALLTTPPSALGGFLEANEAPMLLPGMPDAVADKTLYESVLDPAVLANGPTPAVPHPRAGAKVTGLLAQVDPGWSGLVAGGWQPTDPRMTELDVTGLLDGRHFALQLVVGSARWHPGYGTASVADWRGP